MKTKCELIQTFLLGAVTLQAVVASVSIHAATINWTNTASGAWNTAANWDPNTVPGAADIAVITNSGITVSLNGATTVGAITLGDNGPGTVTLSLGGQTLTLNGPLSVNTNGAFTVDGGALVGNANSLLSGTIGWSAGSLGGSFTLTAGSTLNVTSTNDHSMKACTFVNNGSVIWSGGQILCGETYYSSGSTTITNLGLWDSQGDLILNGSAGFTGPVFNNLGTFRKSAGTSSNSTTITSAIVFNQLDGAVDVQQGSLVLQGGGSFAGGTATNHNGVLWLSGGNFNLNGTVTGTNVIENGGNLSGGILIQGGLEWQSGSWGYNDNGNNWHAAGVTLDSGGLLMITTTNDHPMRSSTFLNKGSVVWSGGQISCGQVFYMAPNTVITNGGIWEADGDLTLNGDVGYTGTIFNNLGTFRKFWGMGNMTITGGVVFNQLGGALDVQQGNLVLLGGGSFTGGTATNNNGALWLSGGNFNLNGTVTGTNVIENGGNLSGGNLIQGGLQWHSGSWNSAGVTLDSGGLLCVTTTNDHFMQASTFINNGSVLWSGGQICCGQIYYMSPNTIITNNGTWESRGDLTLNGNVGYTGTTFNNPGTFRKSAGTGDTIFTGGVTLNNAGTLDAQTGNIAVQGGYTLATGTQMSFGLGGAAGNGSISLSGPATFAGSASVNLNGFFWPAPGSVFNLLNYTSESGLLFTNLSLPATGYITWQTNYNLTAFTLSVLAHTATNTTPTNMFISTLNGTNLILRWPGDHTGWSIQAQTNLASVGLSTNWSTLAGASETNQLVMPINKTNGAVFFRMVLP